MDQVLGVCYDERQEICDTRDASSVTTSILLHVVWILCHDQKMKELYKS